MGRRLSTYVPDRMPSQRYRAGTGRARDNPEHGPERKDRLEAGLRGIGDTEVARLKAGFQACARSLIWAFRRLLCRAALFLWMMPLSAMRSMTGTAAV